VNGFPASFSSTFRCISFISFERHKLNWKMVQTSTIVAATVGTVATGFIGVFFICSFEAQLIMLIAYAFYFDYKRRNDPQFRKQLKKESKRQARAAKEEAEAQTVQQRQSIRRAVEEAKEEGFPTDVEEKEAYFMSEVARGEGLSGDGKQYAPYSQT
jgi:import receptor subunit TOM20